MRRSRPARLRDAGCRLRHALPLLGHRTGRRRARLSRRVGPFSLASATARLHVPRNDSRLVLNVARRRPGADAPHRGRPTLTPNAAMARKRLIQLQSAKYCSFTLPLNTPPENQCGASSPRRPRLAATSRRDVSERRTTNTSRRKSGRSSFFVDLRVWADDSKPPKPPSPK